MKDPIKKGLVPTAGKQEAPTQAITEVITDPHYTIRQYYPTFTPIPQPGEIRELCDRSGNVAHLARVIITDPGSRTAALRPLFLFPDGREI